MKRSTSPDIACIMPRIPIALTSSFERRPMRVMSFSSFMRMRTPSLGTSGAIAVAATGSRKSKRNFIPSPGASFFISARSYLILFSTADIVGVGKNSSGRSKETFFFDRFFLLAISLFLLIVRYSFVRRMTLVPDSPMSVGPFFTSS